MVRKTQKLVAEVVTLRRVKCQEPELDAVISLPRRAVKNSTAEGTARAVRHEA